MKLEEVASIYQGAFIARVEEAPSPNTVRLPVYTMKDMSEHVDIDFGSGTDRNQEVFVSKLKWKELPIAKAGLIVVNLTAQRAAVLQPEHFGKLIPSNFAVIELQDSVDSDYLEWYMNEHPHCRKQLMIATQGSSVSALSIQMLRALEVDLPPLAKQLRMGKIYRLINRKHRLLKERMILEKILIRHTLLELHREEHS